MVEPWSMPPENPPANVVRDVSLAGPATVATAPLAYDWVIDTPGPT